jgi:hypothetical protein
LVAEEAREDHAEDAFGRKTIVRRGQFPRNQHAGGTVALRLKFCPLFPPCI